MHVLIINGPNLNLLGTREPEIYGNVSFDVYFEGLKTRYPDLKLSCFQSNHEGQLIDAIQSSNAQAFIINAGGFSHSSIALADALKAINKPCIAVHISNLAMREDFRKTDFIADACNGCISGLGLEGYDAALDVLTHSNYQT